MSERPPDDDVPISVRLGTVVPPEDPEDWRRPLTWVAALGMLAGPLVAWAWFAIAPPASSAAPVAGTWLLAGALVVGAVLTGSTQIGAFIIVGAAMAGERQLGSASPTVAHGFFAALAGLAGALAASTVAPALARARTRLRRTAAPAAIGVAVAALVLQLLGSL